MSLAAGGFPSESRTSSLARRRWAGPQKVQTIQKYLRSVLAAIDVLFCFFRQYYSFRYRLYVYKGHGVVRDLVFRLA